MKSGIFFISSTSTATLKLLGLLFVLQPTQHGLICASVAKRLKKPKQMSQATGFCRSAVLMTLCLQSFGFVSFKGNVDLDLPIYLIKGISFENLTMKLWKQSNYRKGNILVTALELHRQCEWMERCGRRCSCDEGKRRAVESSQGVAGWKRRSVALGGAGVGLRCGHSRAVLGPRLVSMGFQRGFMENVPREVPVG